MPNCDPRARFDPTDAEPYFKLATDAYAELFYANKLPGQLDYSNHGLARYNAGCFYNECSIAGGRGLGTAMAGDSFMVNAQDQQNHIYGLGQQYFEFKRAVGGVFSYEAIRSSVCVAGGYFGFPPSAPLTTFGNPNHHGIIAAQLFDPNTQYKWAQQMKGQFPRMALITSPEVAHGERSKDSTVNDECQYNINKYLHGNGFDNQPQDGLFCYTPELRKLL